MLANKLRIRRAAQIVCVRTDGSRLAVGEAAMRRVDIIPDATLVVGPDGRISRIVAGSDGGVAGETYQVDIDGKGMCVLPGLVDAHTHPVWAGDRVHEFAMKLGGATYLEIHKAGGGISYTLKHTNAASESELQTLLEDRLKRMCAQGTTLTEAKSGYGLVDAEAELRQLRLIHKVNQKWSKTGVELVGNFLGAHSSPPGRTAEEHTKIVLEQMVPALKQAIARGEVSPKFADVFHETGVFDAAQTRAILEACKKECGLDLAFHGDELHNVGSAELAGELGAASVSHLELISDAGIVAMAKRPSFAVLLPTTAYLMRLTPPPARKLISGNVPVALGSDYNPNAHCLSMPNTMNLACVLMKMSMEEALVASTLNSAAALGMSDNYGTLEVGKFGDCLVLNAPRWEHLIYEMADPPITHVFKKGQLVFEKKN